MGIRFASFLNAIIFSLFFCSVAFAQKADSSHGKDVRVSTLNDDTNASMLKTTLKHSPKKALLYSLVCPGLGQAYNHKYWKIPIIYAGLGTFTYFIIFNQQQYNIYQSALKTRDAGGMDQFYNVYTSDDLVSARDYYHRDRDLSVIGAAVFYALNIIDAEVDAQLFSFNVDNDISVHFSPQLNTFATCNGLTMAPTLSFVLKLK